MIASPYMVRIAEEVMSLSGLEMRVWKPGKYHNFLWLARAYRQSDTFYTRPVYSNFAPSEIEAAFDLLKAIRSDY